MIACGRYREPVVNDVAQTHVCFRSKSGVIRFVVWPMHRTQGQCLRTVLQQQGTRGHASVCLIAHAAFVVMFERVTSTQVCVADACRHVCCGRGCCCDLVVSSHANTHKHTHTCVLHKPGIRGHALSCLDCLPVAPPVCCRSRGLRPRCTASGAFL